MPSMTPPASAFYPAALIVRTPLVVYTYPIHHNVGLNVYTQDQWRDPKVVYDQGQMMHAGNLGAEYHEYDAEMRTTLRVVGEKGAP